MDVSPRFQCWLFCERKPKANTRIVVTAYSNWTKELNPLCAVQVEQVPIEHLNLASLKWHLRLSFYLISVFILSLASLLSIIG